MLGGFVLAAGANLAPAQAAYPSSGVSCSITPNPATEQGRVVLTCTGYSVGSVVDIFENKNSKVTNPHATPHAIPVGSTGGAIAHPRAAPAPAGTASQPGVFSIDEQAEDPGAASFNVTGYDTLNNLVTIGLSTRVLAADSDTVSRACTDTTAAVSPSRIESGESTTISGKGFASGATVTVTDSAGDTLGTTTASSTGAYSTDVTVSTVGNLTLYAAGAATGACDSRTSSAALAVTTVSGATLPFTGTDGVGLMLLIAVALLAAGSGILAAGRRRRLIAGARLSA